MIGKIESIAKSKSGKSWRVKVGGKFYGANFDSQLSTDTVGKTIDFVVESGEFGDWIKSWGYGQAAAQEASSPEADRWWLNFVSNCCGQAIACGTLKEPGQIKPWADAAFRAVTGLKQGWTPQNPNAEEDGPTW